TQALYRQYTQEALARGVFGAPIYVVDGVRYWGQDRLAFVDRALARLRAARLNPAPPPP
ncbi:MAG: DsbA family protein, partial [Pseudomonadota bacterium]|nr:DsbA family protein [Pseudomonadota bacterium]